MLWEADAAAHESPLLSYPWICLSQAHESVAFLTFSRIAHLFDNRTCNTPSISIASISIS